MLPRPPKSKKRVTAGPVAVQAHFKKEAIHVKFDQQLSPMVHSAGRSGGPVDANRGAGLRSYAGRWPRNHFRSGFGYKQGQDPEDAGRHPDFSVRTSPGCRSGRLRPQGTRDPRAIDYPGDSDKPQVFNAGNNIVITFNTTYCPADATQWPDEEQRFQTYLSLQGVTIPYACLWVSRLQWNPGTQSLRPVGPGGELYLTEQITSGQRSVKQDVPVPQQPGFGVICQEDPLGLQLGNAEGPGTGASGANSTGGTDVWYMHLDTNNNSTPDFIANDWSEPVRLTGNTTDTRDLQGPLRTSHGPGLYEDGKAAAARPQLRLIGRRAVFAWEEKKATTGIDEGKYIRYHTIPEFTDTSALPINGCIISRPIENGRRVRILTQPLSAGSTGIVFIYKQGDFTQGGPSDIMLRRAIGGYEPVN